MSCYDHPMRGDYNTVQFPKIFEKERKKTIENTVALMHNRVSNYTKTIILLRFSEYCEIC